MSSYWLKQDHVDAVQALLPYITDESVRVRMEEVLLGLATDLTTQVMSEATAEIMNRPIAPLTVEELQAVQLLVSKGVQQNGLIPELSAVQVGRSLQVVSELLGRAHAGALDFDDQDGLMWVFDVAAEAEGGVNRDNVRRLENLVRAGLGIDTRIANLAAINVEPC